MYIFLIGFMGSGKSYWGQQLADSMKMQFVDLDSEIETRQKQSIADIFEEKGEKRFREMERHALEDLVKMPVSMLIACGGGTPCFFDNIDFMKKNGLVVWLDPSIETLADRLRPEKAKRPLVNGIADEELTAFIQKKLAERISYYRQAHLHIHQEPFTLENILQQIGYAY